MLAGDATRSEDVRTPESSGTNTSDLGLVEIDHETLSDDGIEGTVDNTRRRWSRSDVPDEHAVVQPRQNVIALDADGALQPPVRRVQPVRMVRAVGVQSDLRQFGRELAALVDPDVPTRV